MKRTPGSRMVLVSGLEARILGLRLLRGYAINVDSGYVDRRRFERARRRLAQSRLTR